MSLFSGKTIVVEEENSNLTRSKQWADTVIDMPDWTVAEIDRPYVKATLVAASMFELPLKELSVAIEPSQDNYKIVISGYRQSHSFVVTYRTFLDPSRRGPNLEQIEDAQWQPAQDGSGIIITFFVKRMHFRTATKSAGANGGGGSKGSSLGERQFKKRF